MKSFVHQWNVRRSERNERIPFRVQSSGQCRVICFVPLSFNYSLIYYWPRCISFRAIFFYPFNARRCSRYRHCFPLRVRFEMTDTLMHMSWLCYPDAYYEVAINVDRENSPISPIAYRNSFQYISHACLWSCRCKANRLHSNIESIISLARICKYDTLLYFLFDFWTSRILGIFRMKKKKK